jgi:hypothetical protein
MVELIKIIALAILVISDITKLRRKYAEIKKCLQDEGWRARLTNLGIIVTAGAPSIYYSLELEHMIRP